MRKIEDRSTECHGQDEGLRASVRRVLNEERVADIIQGVERGDEIIRLVVGVGRRVHVETAAVDRAIRIGAGDDRNSAVVSVNTCARVRIDPEGQLARHDADAVRGRVEVDVPFDCSSIREIHREGAIGGEGDLAGCSNRSGDAVGWLDKIKSRLVRDVVHSQCIQLLVLGTNVDGDERLTAGDSCDQYADSWSDGGGGRRHAGQQAILSQEVERLRLGLKCAEEGC